MSLCPCHSNRLYIDCCAPYHEGAVAETPAILMRSRFSAYALKNADYIISTTHPSNPGYRAQKKQWKREILAFCNTTTFVNLEIVSDQESGDIGTVVFRAYLLQNTCDASFEEQSEFKKVKGRWLYASGKTRSIGS